MEYVSSTQIRPFSDSSTTAILSGLEMSPLSTTKQLLRCPSSLTRLPLELLSLSQHYLDPLDIISLRLTCKHVSASTRDRTAWIAVLRTICFTHGAFVPSFPFEEMSQRAIEHTALVPFQFLSLLTRGSPSSVQPSAIRILVAPNKGRFTELFLVSGGRFLFTQTVDGRIDLWDLGYSAASVIKPSPIAFLSEDAQWESSIMALEPTKDGTGMYMIIRERSPIAARITIYLVHPLSPNPQFVLFKGPKVFSGGIHYFSASPGVCGVHHGSLFTAWDYIRDLTATWTVGGENYSLISDGCALLFDIKGIKMWNIPEFHASSDDGPFEPEPNVLPAFSLQYARPSGDLFQKCIPYTSWPRGHGRPTILGVMAQADGGPMLDYYTMEPISGNNPRLPNALPLLKASARICKNDIRVIPAIAGRYCGRYFIQPFTTWEDKFFVNVADPDNLNLNRSVQLYEDDISLAVSQYPNTDLYGFCPMSARLCGLLTGGREIRVMDFVLPH